MNGFQQDLVGTIARTLVEHHVEAIRQHGGIFVHTVRLTRMPMMITDATLPGNPVIFANQAFLDLSDYRLDESIGQDPHFMNGRRTDPAAIQQCETAMREGLRELRTLCDILSTSRPDCPRKASASPAADRLGAEVGVDRASSIQGLKPSALMKPAFGAPFSCLMFSMRLSSADKTRSRFGFNFTRSD